MQWSPSVRLLLWPFCHSYTACQGTPISFVYNVLSDFDEYLVSSSNIMYLFFSIGSSRLRYKTVSRVCLWRHWRKCWGSVPEGESWYHRSHFCSVSSAPRQVRKLNIRNYFFLKMKSGKRFWSGLDMYFYKWEGKKRRYRFNLAWTRAVPSGLLAGIFTIWK